VFFCSHILEEVEKVCDRVGILNQGELVALDTIDNLRTEIQAGATVSATLDAVPDALNIERVDGVRDATVDDRTVAVECVEPAAKMRVLRHLDDRATVEDVGIEEASLEALFSEYTNEDADDAVDDGDTEPAIRAAAADGGESA